MSCQNVFLQEVCCYQSVRFSFILFDFPLVLKRHYHSVRHKMFFLLIVSEDVGFIFHIPHTFTLQYTKYIPNFLISFMKIVICNETRGD